MTITVYESESIPRGRKILGRGSVGWEGGRGGRGKEKEQVEEGLWRRKGREGFALVYVRECNGDGGRSSNVTVSGNDDGVGNGDDWNGDINSTGSKKKKKCRSSDS